MTIADLSYDQKLALVALMRYVVMSNATVTEGEKTQIDMVAKAFGEDEYRKLLDDAEGRFADMASLQDFLSGIEGQEARELVFGTIWQESVADPDIKHSESELLAWLAKAWGIKVESA